MKNHSGIVLCCVIAFTAFAASDARASLITRTCAGSVAVVIPMMGGGGGTSAAGAPSCTADSVHSSMGGDSFVTAAGFYSQSYTASIENHYASTLVENASSFNLTTGLWGQGSLSLSAMFTPAGGNSGPGAPGQGAIFATGNSLDTFSVDRPYSFSLTFTGFGLPELSPNFGTYSGGVLTGLFVPGELYSIAFNTGNTGAVLASAAANTGPHTFSGAWGGRVSITATDVPEPGTLALLGAGLLLLAIGSRFRRSAAA